MKNHKISELYQALKQVSLVDVDSVDEEIRDEFIEHLEALELLVGGSLQDSKDDEWPPTTTVKH